MAFLDAVAHLAEPVALSLRLASQEARLRLGLVVSGFDAASADRAVRQVCALAASCMPWYGFAPSENGGLELPESPSLATRVTGGGQHPPRAEVGDGSSLAIGLARQDALVSVALSVAVEAGELHRCADVVVAGIEPVGALGALVALEVGGEWE